MLFERTRTLLHRLLAKAPAEPTAPGIDANLDGRSAIALVEGMMAEGAGLAGPAPEDFDARALLDALTHPIDGAQSATLDDDRLDPADGPRGALASAMGMALSGLRTTVFANGRDLPGLSDLLGRAAGQQLPIVVHAACTAGGGPTRAVGDGHHGYHAVADTGAVQLFARSVQEAVDLTLIARRITESALLPVIVAHDAQATGLTEAPVTVPRADAVLRYLGRPDGMIDAPTFAQEQLFGPRRRRVVRWHDLDRPLLIGAAHGPEAWPLLAPARAAFIDADVARLVEEAFEAFFALTGRRYQSAALLGDSGADLVVVAQGSLLDQAEAAAEALRHERRRKISVLALTVLRPLPRAAIAEALRGRPRVLVLDRSDRPLGVDPPLAAELSQVLDRALHPEPGVPSEARPWTPKERPPLWSARVGHGAPVRVEDIVAYARQIFEGNAASGVHLGIEAEPDLSAWPKRQSMQDNLRAHAPHIRSLRAPRDADGATGATPRSAPAAVRQVRRSEPRVSSLARFWDQVGALYAAGAEDRLSPDPFLATGTVPVLSASFRDLSSTRSSFPEFHPDLCTGCGVCWSTCPEGAIGATVQPAATLLEAGMEQAKAAGHNPDALRPLVNKIAKAATRSAARPGAPCQAGPLLTAAFEGALAKSTPDPERQAKLQDAFALAIAPITDLPVSATDAFLRRPADRAPGAGALLSLTIDPDACKGCGLCSAACEPGALLRAPEDPARTASARALRRAWAAIPDTPGAIIDALRDDDPVTPLAASLLSRHSVGLVGGDDVEPGSGERQALRLVLAEVEAHRQRVTARHLGHIAELQTALATKIRGLLDAALPVNDLDALSQGLEGLASPDLDLAALTARVGGAVGADRIDAMFLHHLTRSASALRDLDFSLREGPQGLGRSRFGLVLSDGALAERIARFPHNPFTVPVVVTSAGESARLARGLFEGQLASAESAHATVEEAEQLRDLDREPPVAAPARRQPFDELDEAARRLVPPVVIVGDEASLGEAELGSLLALLATRRPFKVVVLADPGRRLGPGGGTLPLNLGLLAALHRQAYVAQSSVAFPEHFGRALHEAIAFDGPALLHLYAPSPCRDGVASDASLELGRLAVTTRTFPLFTYDPRRPGVLGARIDLSGNPEPEHAWVERSQYKWTPADWLAAQGRFEARFAAGDIDGVNVAEWLGREDRSARPTARRPDGARVIPEPRLLAAVERWAGDWRALQEIAGVVTPFTARVTAEAEARLTAEHRAALDALQTKHAAELAALEADRQAQTAERVTDRLLELAGYGRASEVAES